MTVSAIQSVLQQLRATALSASGASFDNTAAADAVAGGSFADEMKKSLARVSNAQQNALGQAQDFELGKPGVALNDVMVDLQKANIGFQMSLQVRNKLVAAYQEIMNIPA